MSDNVSKLYKKFESKNNETSLIIQEEIDSVWVYLLDAKDRILSDIWLCNSSNDLKDKTYYLDLKVPPPADPKIIDASIIIKDIEQFEVNWIDDTIILLFDNNEIVKFDNGKFYSKLLASDSAWGNKWVTT